MANEIIEVLETSITNSTNDLKLINKDLQRHTKAIEKLMNATKRNMFEISARLLVIRNEELYKEDNYKDVFDYAKQILGYNKNMVYKLVNTAEKYIQPSLTAKGYESILAHGNADYTVSQLIELNSLETYEAITLDSNGDIKPSMTTKEIRDVVKEYKNPSNENVEGEGESDKPRETDKTFDLILKSIDNLDKIMKDERITKNNISMQKLLEMKNFLLNIEF